MPTFVLDTDHVSLFQRSSRTIEERILGCPSGSVVTTTVTLGEQLRGRLKAIRRASDGPSTVAAYDRIQATVEFFQNIPLLRFDASAYDRFVHLRQQKIRIGTHDLRIAAIVLTTESVLVTRNARDFSQVPGLEFEDWSAS